MGDKLTVTNKAYFNEDVEVTATKKLYFQKGGGPGTSDDYAVGLAPGGTEFYSKGAKVLVLDSAGSALHGSWTAVSATLSSDAKLKKDIVPLYKTLSTLRKNYYALDNAKKDLKTQSATMPGEPTKEFLDQSTKDLTELFKEAPYNKQYNTTYMLPDTLPCVPGQTDCTEKGRELEEMSIASEMLSELRPVSYFMKTENNVEAKNLRFGFIAQEVEKFLPSLVKTHPNTGDKSILYSDIIAVITMALQHELHLTQSLMVRVEDHEERLVKLESRDELVAKLEQEILLLKQKLVGVVEQQGSTSIVEQSVTKNATEERIAATGSTSKIPTTLKEEAAADVVYA